MNTLLPNETASAGTTPPWLKHTMVSLLILFSIAGFTFTALQATKLGTKLPTDFGQALPRAPKIQNNISFSDIMEKAKLEMPSGHTLTVTCQGVLSGDNGRSLAVINGKTVGVDDELDGMSILAINPTNVTVKFEGKEYRLYPGETFVLGK